MDKILTVKAKPVETKNNDADVWNDSEERFLLLVFRERRLWSRALVIQMSDRPFTRDRMLIFSSQLAERCK